MENKPLSIDGTSSANRTVSTNGLVRPRRTARRVLNPSRTRSELPGVKLSTYRTKGSASERGNLEPGAGRETPGTPPSPVTSRPRGGGAFVVVGARESRVQGEGRQSMSASDEAHPGADLRSRVLPYFLRLQARTLRARCACAPESVADAGRSEALGHGGSAAVPVGNRRRHQGLLRSHRPSRVDGAGASPRMRRQAQSVDRRATRRVPEGRRSVRRAVPAHRQWYSAGWDPVCPARQCRAEHDRRALRASCLATPRDLRGPRADNRSRR